MLNMDLKWKILLKYNIAILAIIYFVYCKVVWLKNSNNILNIKLKPTLFYRTFFGLYIKNWINIFFWVFL